MNRFSLVTAFLIGFSSPATAQEPMQRPNIVFILTDDQGYGDLSAHGNPILKTPHLDRLHAEGVRFTNFQVSPTCSPTRSALLTGRHEFKNGVTHTILERERLTPKATTIAQVLRSAGYTTGIFGKWHLGDAPEYWPSRRGFDEMYIHGCGGIGQRYPNSSGGDVPGNTYFDPILLHNGRLTRTQGYCTDLFFQQAQRWMAAVKGKQPFFCYIATNAPHAPLQVRPEDEARYKDKVRQPNQAKFFGMIANIDDNVGKLLGKLQEWELERNTLVIFMNDNGGTVGVPVFNAGMRGAKVTAWAGGVRAASLWRWPGTLTPADCDRLTAHLDFFPTLAELAGAKLSPELQQQVEGRSLVPLLRNPQAPWADRTLFTHVGRWPRGADPNDFKQARCAVRSTRWRLVSEGKAPWQWQLFDMQADPGEKENVADRHPDVVRQMTAAYDAWWASLPPYLVNENAVGPPESTFAELYRKQMGTDAKPPKKPHVLFLFADDMRADSIAALGNPDVHTPHLDALVRRGFTMTNAYCLGGNTGAVCTPSRNMLLSGNAYFRWKDYTPPNMPRSPKGLLAPGDGPNLPLSMKAAGYVTYHHGKRGNTAPLIQARFEINKYLKNDDGERRSGEPGKEILDDAIAFWKHYQEDRPVFMYLAFGNPHDPRVAAAPYRQRYNPDSLALPKNFLPVHPFDNGELIVRDERLLPWPRTPAEVRDTLVDYYATVTALDHHIGRLLQTLRDLGQLENTLVVFSADQGIAVGSHGLLGKQNLYDHSMKAPLILAGPGIAKGRSDALVYLFDIYPTLCACVGGAMPAGIDGRSFAPLLQGQPQPGRSELLLAYRDKQRALCTQRWKLIRYPEVNMTQLFDLQTDPEETTNLAEEPGQQDRVRQMTEQLAALQKSFGDALPLRKENAASARPMTAEILRQRVKAPPR